jgi:hypothetical protein
LRATLGPKKPLELKPVYTAVELAQSIGISRRRFIRLLERHEVLVYRVGWDILVPLSEVRDKLQPFWASLLAADQKRQEVDESSNSFRLSHRTPLRDP